MDAIKLERFNNAFMEQLNIIFGTKIKNPSLKSVIVNAVKITNDLSSAKVYFTCFDDDKKNILKELNDSSGFIRHELASLVDIRHMPELIFKYDESLEYAKKIEDKIREINEKS